VVSVSDQDGYRAKEVPGSSERSSVLVTQIVPLMDPFSPVSPAGRPEFPLPGIAPCSATSMMSPEAQWNLGFGTVAPFLVFVGKVSLVEKENVVVEPLDQLIDDVPLVAAAAKWNTPVPGALGEGVQPPTDTVPVAFPLNVLHEPLTGLGLELADAPGASTATTSMGIVSAETSARSRAKRDRCMRFPLI